MSRTEASNTFTDGLVSDLNPINTPNTVLTDCLNGTIITYDGNEFILQNDKGNYPLKDCKLKENYIPVGIKEHGDILYIVSYNPLDEHVEIGSYPSPLNVKDSANSAELGLNIDSIGSKILSKNTPTIDYSDIINSMEELQFFYGGIPEENKLNPGDKYKLEVETDSSKCKYEDLEYYVVDENRKTYNITDQITINSDYKYIEWNIPGWIGIKPRFANIDDLKINVRKLIIPTYSSKLTISLNFQILASDPIFAKYLESGSSDLYIRLKVKALNNNIESNLLDTEVIDINIKKYIKYNNDTFIYRVDWSPSTTFDVTETSILNIEATPILKVNINSRNIDVLYDSCRKTLSINLNKRGDPAQLRVGDNSWWYRTDSEDKLLTLKFDTVGLDNASVLSEDVYLSYSIYRVNNNSLTLVEGNSGNKYQNILLEDWNLLGETIIEFPLMEFTQNNYTNYPNRLYQEDVYIFEFKFWEDTNCTTAIQGSSVFKKMVVATKLMNDFGDTCYDKIAFNRWIDKLEDSIENKNFTINSAEFSTNFTSPQVTYSEGYNRWITANSQLPSEYNTFKSITDMNGIKTFKVTASTKNNLNFNFSYNVITLTGPLWIDLLENSKLYYDITGDISFSGEITPNKFTGFEISEISKSINASISKAEDYLLTGTVERNLWNYKIEPLKTNIPFNSSTNTIGTSVDFDLKGTAYKDDGKYDNGARAQLFFNYKSVYWPSTYSDLYKITTAYPKEPSYIKVETRGSIPKVKNTLWNTNKLDSVYITFKIHCASLKDSGGEYFRFGVKNADYEVIESYSDLTQSNNDDLAESINFAVFNVNNSLLFAKVADLTKFITWASKVEHIISDPKTARKGTFYYASSQSTSDIENSEVGLEGRIESTSFNFRGYNLLSSERESIGDGISNNFKLAADVTSSYNSLSPIKMEKVTSEVLIPIEIKNSLASKLSEISSSISSRNSIVRAQEQAVGSNPIYNKYDEYSDYFVYSSEATNRNTVLLEALNKNKLIGSGRNLVATVKGNEGGSARVFGVIFGQDLGDCF